MPYTPLPYPNRDIAGWTTVTQEMVDVQKKNRKEWVAQLRSGKYAQVKNHLHQGEGYCCLGVLCDIVDSKLWKPSESSSVFSFNGVSIMTPPRMESFEFGLRRSNGTFEPNDAFFEKFPKVAVSEAWRNFKSIALTDLNDEGFSFAEIADIIEYGPPKLFYTAGDVF